MLAQHCLDCHSGAKPKGRLDLTNEKAVLRGGKNGPAVVAGKPAASVLWQRVDAGEMPPKHPLGAADRNALKDWIAAGARWGDGPIDPFRYTTAKRAGYDWWSLRPVQRPALPADGADRSRYGGLGRQRTAAGIGWADAPHGGLER